MFDPNYAQVITVRRRTGRRSQMHTHLPTYNFTWQKQSWELSQFLKPKLELFGTFFLAGGIVGNWKTDRSIGNRSGMTMKVLVKMFARSMSVDRLYGTELLSVSSMKPAIARNCLELAQSNYPHSVYTRVY